MTGVDVNVNPLVEYINSLGYSIEKHNGNGTVKTYTSLESELDSIYNGVGLRNISHTGIIELKGADTLDFIHRISTNAVKDLPKEGLTNTVFVTEKGRIIDLATIMNFEGHQLLICSDTYKLKVLSWINKYIITDDVKANDANGKYTLLELIGPQADSIVTLVCGSIVNSIPPDSFKIINTEGMLFFLLKIKEKNGSIKFWIIADANNAHKFTRYVFENKGPFNLNLVGEESYNIYRIEQGLLSAPEELNDNYNPLESGLKEYISFTKGCFIGQEVIARLDTYDKVQKNLCGIELEEFPGMTSGILLYNNEDNEAGIITSVVESTRLRKIIGLAYIHKSFLSDETELFCKMNAGKKIKIKLASVPFKK
ncbi:MAG: aminomethyl transferase family protein [Ignavibacteriales bacterium]|nr:MAG: aminomethyl transferase family protein [Ignavibacteriales bacterium]